MPKRPYPVTLIGTNQTFEIPVSFESGEQVTALLLPVRRYRCKLKTVQTSVTKAMAATDAGTVVIKKGSTALATVTIPLSSALVTVNTATVTETVFEVTDQISITTAKTTAGGKAMLFIEVEVLPSH